LNRVIQEWIEEQSGKATGVLPVIRRIERLVGALFAK
jgi:hypothetical protein